MQEDRKQALETLFGSTHELIAVIDPLRVEWASDGTADKLAWKLVNRFAMCSLEFILYNAGNYTLHEDGTVYECQLIPLGEGWLDGALVRFTPEDRLDTLTSDNAAELLLGQRQRIEAFAQTVRDDLDALLARPEEGNPSADRLRTELAAVGLEAQYTTESLALRRLSPEHIAQMRWQPAGALVARFCKMAADVTRGQLGLENHVPNRDFGLQTAPGRFYSMLAAVTVLLHEGNPRRKTLHLTEQITGDSYRLLLSMPLEDAEYPELFHPVPPNGRDICRSIIEQYSKRFDTKVMYFSDAQTAAAAITLPVNQNPGSLPHVLLAEPDNDVDSLSSVRLMLRAFYTDC